MLKLNDFRIPFMLRMTRSKIKSKNKNYENSLLLLMNFFCIGEVVEGTFHQNFSRRIVGMIISCFPSNSGARKK